MRTYPRVVTIAEKFEAMVNLGRRNSRMKDFHDIWALPKSFPFDGAELCAAIARCFERRGMAWTDEIPDALTPAFYADSRSAAPASPATHRCAELAPESLHERRRGGRSSFPVVLIAVP